ncbi:MAG: CDP-2,3-bis-(O-geranylgeranyl)-sn-glycerol synthase [Thermoplasmata archaeon]
MVLQTLVLSFWLFIPAYVANPAAVIFGGGAPVDLGKRWKDGRRLFGEGKTWRGLLGGGFSGVFVGILQWASLMPWGGSPFSHGSFPQFLGLVAALSFGALLGDLLGSFIKRRLGIEKGHKAPVLDQYDFVLGAFLLTGALYPGWTIAHYLSGEALLGLLLIVGVTPLLHRAVNLVGYRIGKKEVPW